VDAQILEDIGLTNAEIKVYLALLELGSSTAGPIIEKSGLQSSVVHLTLPKLLAKGLISVVKEGKRSHYSAADPRTITNLIDEKKAQFEQLLPQLLLKQQMAGERSQVSLFEGIRGIKELLYLLLEAGGKEHHTIGSPIESVMMGDAWWEQYHRKRATKGIYAKLLFNESLRKWGAEARYPKREIRYMREGVEPLTETIIRNDKVAIIIWTEKPIGVIIHNKAAAESYDRYFEMLWKSSRA
jgi:sugar-specific transcriptional regulator TrmB